MGKLAAWMVASVEWPAKEPTSGIREGLRSWGWWEAVCNPKQSSLLELSSCGIKAVLKCKQSYRFLCCHVHALLHRSCNCSLTLIPDAAGCDVLRAFSNVLCVAERADVMGHCSPLPLPAASQEPSLPVRSWELTSRLSPCLSLSPVPFLPHIPVLVAVPSLLIRAVCVWSQRTHVWEGVVAESGREIMGNAKPCSFHS